LQHVPTSKGGEFRVVIPVAHAAKGASALVGS
jgi:hypothetical protein